MKLSSVFLVSIILCVVFTASAWAQNITAREIAIFREGIMRGCIKRGIERGGNPDHVRKFCTCSDAVFKENLSDDDWQEVVYLATKGAGPEDIPKLTSLFQKFQECKKWENE